MEKKCYHNTVTRVSLLDDEEESSWQTVKSMAKKFGFGALLAFGTVAAVLGGAAAYLNRKSIEKTVQDIADQLDAREEEGFFSVDLEDEEPVIHVVEREEESQGDAGDESDFVDADGQAEDAPVQEEPETPEA